MAYRNKTFVSFASEDIDHYRLMTAWNANRNIDFNFHDAHDLNTALDTSQPDTIRARLRERLSNTKQVVMLVSDTLRPKAARPSSFIHYEVEVIARLGLPVVFANLNGARTGQRDRIPNLLRDQYAMAVSFNAAIIKYALDRFPEDFETNARRAEPRSGIWHYKESVYSGLGL